MASTAEKKGWYVGQTEKYMRDRRTKLLEKLRGPGTTLNSRAAIRQDIALIDEVLKERYCPPIQPKKK